MATKKINTRQLKRTIKILKVLIILLTRIRNLEKKMEIIKQQSGCISCVQMKSQLCQVINYPAKHIS